MTNTIPPRAGLVGELKIFAVAITDKFATANLTGEATIVANGYAGKAGSANLLLELVGGQIQPAGKTYDPAVIGIPNGASAKLVLELLGSDPDNTHTLALNWEAGYGWKYGPQASDGGGGGSSTQIETVSFATTDDGQQVITPIHTIVSILGVFINGLQQRLANITIVSGNISIPTSFNVIAGDIIDVQYSF